MKTVWINGSPKKKFSVSEHLLRIIQLFSGSKGEIICLRSAADRTRILESLRDGDAVVFGLPLYFDCIPSHALKFMREMEAFCGSSGIRLKVYVLSNSGFIEGCQNNPTMQVFENFCRRCQFDWCGGVGIGGGVMLNVLRILTLVQLVLCGVNIFTAGLFPALEVLVQYLLINLFFHIGVLLYGLKMGLAIRKGSYCGVRYTRAMLPSFIFILITNIYFTAVSLFQGGMFRGWLRPKAE